MSPNSSRSAIVGEGTEIRRRVEETRAAIADLAAQLEAIPAWLKVGHPERFAEEGDREAARTADDLAGELQDQTFELGRALQLLDQVLSPVPVQPLPVHPVYGVLLPVRLETRFVRPAEGAAPGTDDAKWRLRLRVEPDPVSLPAGGRAATEHEAHQVADFWTTCNGDLSTPEAEAAFASLAGRVGAARAACLLRTVAVDRENGGFAVDPDAGPGVVPPVLGLPHQLEIWGDGVKLATLQPRHDEIRGTFDLAAVRPDADGTIPRTWWNSYSEAETVGLACEIVLGETRPFFATLLCVGLNQRDQEPLTRQVFEAHAAAGTLGTLAPLTPTNTVDGQPTVDLGRDPAPWLGVARQPLGDVAGLTALTGTPLLEGMPAPDTIRHDTAGALVRALWPVLWQRSLKDIGDLGEGVYRLGEYAGRHLHPFGPFPVLRVGDLPYGVLPVSFYRQWTHAADDPPFEGTQVGVGIDHVDLLASTAGDELTAKDADAERLLRVLAQTPTAREYGSRHLPPTALWAAFQAVIEGIDPAEVVARWDAQADLLLNELGHAPRRRYSPLLFIEPWPEDVHPDYQQALGRYLESTWLQLAEVNDLGRLWLIDDRSPHPLARLVRQSLLLTNIEICRLFSDQVPDPRPTSYLLPLDDPQRMFNDATELEGLGLLRVRDLPEAAVDLVNGNTQPQLPRYDAVVRQFEDVREAVGQLIGTDSAVTDPVLTGVLDAAGHRPDVWLTAAATRRLRQLTSVGAEPILGAYGWVDSLAPSDDPTPPTRAGLVHAPSYTQALTAAVLRDHVVHDDTDPRWQMTLSSTTVRAAAELADQVRTGIPLGEALGREIERRFPEPNHVLELRNQFRARPEWAGRRVCDGQQVLDAATLPAWLPADDLDDLRAALDAYADLLVTDAVHDVVAGRPDAAAEALEAAAGLGAPPELRLLRTPREGGTVRTDVAFVIRYDDAWETTGTHPVEVADPAFARFLRAEVGAAKNVTWTTADDAVSLRDLGLKVVDLLVTPSSVVTAMVRERIGGGAKGSGPVALRTVARLASMLGQPYALNPGAADVLRARLGRLRTMAGDLGAAITTATPQGLRRWGLDEDPAAAAVTLQARLDRVGAENTDASVDADTLADRIRVLVPTQLSLPLVCPDEAPGVSTGSTADGNRWLDDWLPVTAAVRPALAKVEAALLRTSRTWRAAGSDSRPWRAPEPTPDGISGDMVATVAIGPAAGRADGRGIVRLDSWGETVPAARHTTWSAFGYDAPRARAPQAVLLVVPSFLSGGVDVAETRRAVLTARDMVRARSVSATPDRLSVGIPTGVVEAVGSAACTLSEVPL